MFNKEDEPINKIKIDSSKVSNDNDFTIQPLELENEQAMKTYFKIKGFYVFYLLLGSLVLFLVVDYFCKGILVKDIFELLKAIIFTISGYLFGRNNEN